MRNIPFLLLLLLFGLSSCSVTKLLPEGELLYTGASLEVEHPDTVKPGDLKTQLEVVLAPTPTPKWKVWFNLKFQTEKEKGFKHWLSTQIGREPVYYDPAINDQVVRMLENRAHNVGFFRSMAAATPDIDTAKKEASVDYTITVQAPYVIDTLYRDIRDTSVAYIVDSIADETLLQESDRYNLFVLQDERRRIQEALRNDGYYYFSANDLEYFADTVGNMHQVELLLKLKDDIDERRLMPQYIREVNVFSNYVLGTAREQQRGDTLQYEGLRIICDDCPLRPFALAEGIAYRPGERYNPYDHQRTLQRLANFNTFKYISLSYDTVPGQDSLLRLDVFLTPRARRTIEGEGGVVFNSGNYVGPEILLTYTNRNLLRSAEFFRLDGNFTYNFYFGSGNRAAFPSFGRYGLRGTVNVPRLWFPNGHKILGSLLTVNTHISAGIQTESLPFRINDPDYLPIIEQLNLESLRTELEADSNYAPRAAFTTWTFQYGYDWQKRRHVRQETNPLTFRIQGVSTGNDELVPLLREAALQESQGQSNLLRLEPMVIFSPDYIYLIDSRLKELKTHNFFWRQRLAMNFNQVNPLTTTLEDPESERSTYLQFESDFRYYLLFSDRTSIATRLRGFIGYPFSKRAIIPYFDLYTVGGANSMRAFPPRGIGPGTRARDPNRLSAFSGFGNVLAEANVELRQRFGPMFELALFTDIGNVWEYKTLDPPGAFEFGLNTFPQEIAVAGGIGVRLDLDFLLIRVDFAYPLVIPYERTDLDGLNMVLAFGYPF